MLTADQQKQLKEKIGEPFKGVVRGGIVTGPVTGPGGGFPGRTTITTPVYLSLSGMIFTSSKALHDELKLTEDQIKRLIAHGEKTQAESRRLSAGPREDAREFEKKRQELAQASEKELAAILKPEQLNRFKQLVLQAMDNSSNPRGPGGRFV